MPKPTGAISILDGGLAISTTTGKSHILGSFTLDATMEGSSIEGFAEVDLSVQLRNSSAHLVIRDEVEGVSSLTIAVGTTRWKTDILRYPRLKPSVGSTDYSVYANRCISLNLGFDGYPAGTAEVLAVNLESWGRLSSRFQVFGAEATLNPRLHEANMPCSAFLCMQILASNSNAICSRNTSTMSVPL